MLKRFVKAWEERKDEVRASFAAQPPVYYKDVVKAVVSILPHLDVDRIHVIDDGDYQGTLLFVIAEEGYQPNSYYYAKINYGSCSICDTLQSIKDLEDEEERVHQFMLLALHIVQKLRPMQLEEADD